MSSSTSETDIEARAQAIVERVIARRRAGEFVPDEEVLQRHPELLGVLERLLRHAAFVERARASAQPSQHPLEKLLDGLDLEEDGGDDNALAAETSPANRHIAMDSLAGDDALEAMFTPSPVFESAKTESTDDEQLAAADGSDDRITVHGEDDAEAPIASQPVASQPRHAAGDAGEVVTYRPQSRPPMAVVRVLDDDQVGADEFRIREANFTIGRHTGTIRVPHDGRMSALHARIERRPSQQGWTWTLRDLDSTNGVFVKVGRVRLRHGDQLLMADRTVRFVVPSDRDEPPRLEEIRTDRPGEQLLLAGDDEICLGRDQQVCVPFLADEPMLDPQFARLVPGSTDDAVGNDDGNDDGSRRWSIVSTARGNGLWIRVEAIPIASGAMFQLGEQRFAFRVV
ncbi:MAG: FHA domain-containing protein [Planctomycetota bacterium]